MYKATTRGAYLIFAYLLISCGGAGQSETLIPEFTGPPLSESMDTTVADIAGLWSIEYDLLGLEDEVWAVNEYLIWISETGEYMEIDYLGDSLADRSGSYANCYKVSNNGTIAKLPEGGFVLTFGTEQISLSIYTNFALEGDYLLTAAVPGIRGIETIAAPPAGMDLSEVDAQLCDEEP